MKKEKGQMTFEDAMRRLEESVRALESGELSLDASLETFEKAVALVRSCTAALENAKQKVKILTEAQDGTVTEEVFVGADGGEHET